MRSCSNVELFCTRRIICMRSPRTRCDFLHVILFGTLFLILRILSVTILYFVRYTYVRFVLGQVVSFDIYKFSISWQKLLFWPWCSLSFPCFLSVPMHLYSAVCKYVVVMVSWECINLVFVSCLCCSSLALVFERFWMSTCVITVVFNTWFSEQSCLWCVKGSK